MKKIKEFLSCLSTPKTSSPNNSDEDDPTDNNNAQFAHYKTSNADLNRETKAAMMVMEKSNDQKQLPILPNDVILEILLYLPSQSLKRFSPVLDDLNLTTSETPLLQTPSFVKNHAFNMAHHDNKLRYLSNQVLLTFDRQAEAFSTISLDDNNIENTKSLYNNNGVCRVSEILPTEEECLIRLDPRCTKVISSCYGIVFMTVGFGHCRSRVKFHHIVKRETVMDPESLIFWNPFTREIYMVPIPIKLAHWDTMYGFGYDAKNNTFKAVVAQRTKTHIYDLSNNSWELVETINWNNFFKFRHPPPKKFAKFTKGCLHWLVSAANILALDLATNVCTYIGLPSAIPIEKGYFDKDKYLRLDVLRLQSDDDDSLAISFNEWDSLEVGIWLMTQYGKPESWVKQYTIKKDPSLAGTILEPPLWVTLDGELVFNVGDGLAIWDPKTNNFTFIDDKTKPSGAIYPQESMPMMVHVTSFMSPKPNVPH